MKAMLEIDRTLSFTIAKIMLDIYCVGLDRFQWDFVNKYIIILNKLSDNANVYIKPWLSSTLLWTDVSLPLAMSQIIPDIHSFIYSLQ